MFKKIIFFLSILPAFICMQGYAQTPDAAALEFLTELGGETGSSSQRDDDKTGGYKSFVQNEYEGIVKQLKELQLDEKKEIYFSDLAEQRIELATQLCVKDKRACFLIDEYRNFANDESNEIKTFDTLDLFGVDIFSGYVTDFNFYENMPVGGDYKLKIGDVLRILLFGGLEQDAEIDIDRRGHIVIEEVGSVQVAGLTLDDASKKITQEVSDNYYGTEVVISLKQIRAKQVFVIGNVHVPGSYTLNTFGTVLNGLISAGGIKDTSSLRTIKVIRKKNEIAEIDLYNLLIDGDTGLVDLVLQDGDSVVVGGLKKSISILGEVQRPARYEIKDGDNLGSVISYALGVNAFADTNNISIARILPSGKTTVLNPNGDLNFNLENGDKITVNSQIGEKTNYFSINGEIRNAGEYTFNENKVLADFINLERDLLDSSYVGLAVLKRLDPISKSYNAFTFDLTDPNRLNKIGLFSGDQIFILSKEDVAFIQSKTLAKYISSMNGESAELPFEGLDLYDPSKLATADIAKDIQYSAEEKIDISNSKFQCLASLESLNKKPLLSFLESKFKTFEPVSNLSCSPLLSKNSDLLPILIVNSIPVVGNVRFPGIYPVGKGVNGRSLFNLAGGFLYETPMSESSFEIGSKNNGFQDYSFNDLNNISQITFFNPKLKFTNIFEGHITLVGEFNNPGIYSIDGSTTLMDVYERAGGITQNAYPVGGIFTRDSVKEQETKAIERAKQELTEILSTAVTSGYLKDSSTDLVSLVALMTNISNVESIGRLVTELNPSIISRNPNKDTLLESGDIIYMPSIKNVVTVVGQVLNPVTIPFETGSSFSEYISMSGGLKNDADESRIYAILPNGTSIKYEKSFFGFGSADLLPGSTIIVPRQSRPLDSLALVETLSPILANLSVTAASIAAISNN
ncbi:SLBB domain-containing protein [Gammaproteobacteria bacterium]|nr:SLBB domain-containing protein [Gammaproteobacteria bacterium]